jgi:Co/Zn/Cd efflux system component
LLLLAVWLTYEAIRRLITPPEVTGVLVVVTTLVGIVINLAALWIISRATRIFLEAAPEGLDPGAIGPQMAAHPDVVEVHDLHTWEITSGSPALSAHVIVQPSGDCHTVRTQLAQRLIDDHHISTPPCKSTTLRAHTKPTTAPTTAKTPTDPSTDRRPLPLATVRAQNSVAEIFGVVGKRCQTTQPALA